MGFLVFSLKYGIYFSLAVEKALNQNSKKLRYQLSSRSRLPTCIYLIKIIDGNSGKVQVNSKC